MQPPNNNPPILPLQPPQRSKAMLASQIAIITIIALGCIQLVALPYIGAMGYLSARNTVILCSSLTVVAIIALTFLFKFGPRYP